VTDYANLVRMLYAKLGTWKAVAEACNVEADFPESYYWRIANGKLKAPGAKARRGIVSGARSRLGPLITGLKLPRERAERGGIAITRNLWLRLRAVRIRENWTWDQLAEKALECLE
jgi:hypothetical protein